MESAQILICVAANMVGVALVLHIVVHHRLHAAMVTGEMECAQILMIVAANGVGVSMVLLGGCLVLVERINNCTVAL